MSVLKTYDDPFGNHIEVWESVWEHIESNHPEITLKTIETVIKSPETIVQSNWDENSHLYYKKLGKYYKVVIIDRIHQRVKTTLTTNKIKTGETIWPKEQ